MDNEVFPAMQRLQAALQQGGEGLNKILAIMQAAEEEAAALFGLGGAANAPGKPGYRIYLINGINWSGDESTLIQLQGNLKDRFGSQAEVVVVSDHPYDYTQGEREFVKQYLGNNGAAQSAVSLLNTVRGVYAVANEHTLGVNGFETNRVYNWIDEDLRRNPLAAGGSAVLVGHSGGGAIAANLVEKLETQRGTDVSMLVTLGSPVSNYDMASRRVEQVLQVRDPGDFLIGNDWVRSNESRAIVSPILAGLPLSSAAGGVAVVGGGLVMDRATRNNAPNIARETLAGQGDDPYNAHFNYFSRDVSDLIYNYAPI
jgi:predicted alpha/beta-hydrolase family hydrolase